jgi:hypothetical protein
MRIARSISSRDRRNALALAYPIECVAPLLYADGDPARTLNVDVRGITAATHRESYRRQAAHSSETLQLSKDCNRGLDDRCRDRDGEIRRKNGNTRVGTLRETYGPDFAPGVRSDAKLSTILQRAGARSLSEVLKKR